MYVRSGNYVLICRDSLNHLHDRVFISAQVQMVMGSYSQSQEYPIIEFLETTETLTKSLLGKLLSLGRGYSTQYTLKVSRTLYENVLLM